VKVIGLLWGIRSDPQKTYRPGAQNTPVIVDPESPWASTHDTVAPGTSRPVLAFVTCPHMQPHVRRPVVILSIAAIASRFMVYLLKEN
jgi:hypothetical protein